jgi:hypothetical protein
MDVKTHLKRSRFCIHNREGRCLAANTICSWVVCPDIPDDRRPPIAVITSSAGRHYTEAHK